MQARQRLDLYFPPRMELHSKYPVVVYVTGVCVWWPEGASQPIFYMHPPLVLAYHTSTWAFTHSCFVGACMLLRAGGAWTIGYKAWGALLARRMSKHGVIVACLDYKNFPQGSAAQMLEDINTGILWVIECIHKYQGDPDNITLVGQSAGGHLSALALVKQVG